MHHDLPLVIQFRTILVRYWAYSHITLVSQVHTSKSTGGYAKVCFFLGLQADCSCHAGIVPLSELRYPLDNSTLVSRKLGTLCLIAIVIGVLGGIFSWLFRALIAVIHNAVFLGEFSVQYNANQHTPGSWLGWLIIFAPTLGGLVVVFLTKNFAPEAKGHGVPEVMSAIYHRRGLIPGSVSIVKALTSAITIGTGGSLGREGPIIQISAAFSSFIGKLTRVSVSQRNLLIACGASAGIAATFNAPLGGILFSIELLLVTISSRTVLPVAISAVISANIGHYLMESDPAFHIPVLFGSSSGDTALISLLAVPLGAVIALFSIVFIRSIYWTEDQFDKWVANPYLRHTVGNLLLGVLFYAIYLRFGHYYVQGVGYSTIQDTLLDVITDPLFLLFLLVTKLVATNLTVGSGGSGGVFSPALFLGAVTGALFGNIIQQLFPGLGLNPVVFVVSGMAAMISATASAPLTAAIMIYEMTRDYNAILPIMTAVSVAYALRRHFMTSDLYTLKLTRRGQMIPEEMVADLKCELRADNQP
jgi:CIC family chloride channel protein